MIFEVNLIAMNYLFMFKLHMSSTQLLESFKSFVWQITTAPIRHEM